MKTLHRYLLRQILATLLMTVAVFTFVLLLGNVLREILPLLMSQNVSLLRVAQAFGLLIPFVGVYALPMGMLTATLLVFGRFSADQEFTAARASGVSLISLATPVLVLSLLLSGVSALVNMDLGPRSRVTFKRLLAGVTANLTSIQLPEGRPVTFKAKTEEAGPERERETYTVSVGKSRKGMLEDIHVFHVKNETNLLTMLSAPTGSLRVDPAARVVHFYLTNAQVILIESEIPMSMDFKIELDLESARERKPGISDLTFMELRRELRTLEAKLSRPLEVQRHRDPDKERSKQAVKRRVEDITEPYRVQMHRRVAFSFACFAFTLVGIPLGIRVHRRETNIGIVIALVLVGVYYGLLIAAESLAQRPEYAPHLLMWLPNFVFQAVGAVLIWRANRGL